MKCYICNKAGKETDAVAICIVCGIAVCMEHQIREQIPVKRNLQMGFGGRRGDSAKAATPHTLYLVL